MTPEESIQIFENYFKGGKPFKSLKSRVDIPDAFIFSTINKIAKVTYIHFISEDNNLREKLSENVFVRSYKDFAGLFSSNMFSPIQKRYEEIEKYESYKQILLDNLLDISKQFEEFLEEIKPFSFYDRKLVSENSLAIINSILDAKIEIQVNEIKYIDNIFYVPVNVKGNADLDYFIFKDDYRDDNIRKAKVCDWNDDFYLVEDHLPVMIKKVIKVPINDLKVGTDLIIKIEGFDEIKVDKE